MRYPDGSTIKPGDRVRLITGDNGTVVCSIDSQGYSDEYSEKDWSYLREGVIVKTDRGAVIHLKDPNEGDVLPAES